MWSNSLSPSPRDQFWSQPRCSTGVVMALVTAHRTTTLTWRILRTLTISCISGIEIVLEHLRRLFILSWSFFRWEDTPAQAQSNKKVDQRIGALGTPPPPYSELGVSPNNYIIMFDRRKHQLCQFKTCLSC